MSKVLISFLASLFLLAFSVQSSEAKVLFWDNFNDNNSKDYPISWIEYAANGGEWSVENGIYRGSVFKTGPSDDYSYTLIGKTLFDYQYRVKVLGLEGVDKKLVFRYQSYGTRYDINLISGSGIYLQKWINNTPVELWGASFENNSNTWYLIEVSAISNNIIVKVDGQELINVIDSNFPILEGDLGFQIWPGAAGGPGGITKTAYDDFFVCDFDGPCEMPTITPTPTSTPTPTPTPLQKIILIPGVGASWNYEAMIKGESKSQNFWYTTPGVSVYNNLLETLNNFGYDTDNNLFVFNYDWRQPVETITRDLKDYISQLNLGETKVDLIGHSLGGIVARSYFQAYESDNKVDQIITVGAPHLGVVKSYYLWEGADLAKGLSGWQRIGGGIVFNLNKRGYPNDVDALQNKMPVFKDFLPVFPYLTKNNQIIEIESMSSQNKWLSHLNQITEQHEIYQHLYTTGGMIDNSTARWIEVSNRNELDHVLGRWIDGKPIRQTKDTGDNTVLEFSAIPNLVKYQARIEDKDHGEIIDSVDGISTIISLLGLFTSPVTINQTVKTENYLVFQLASPANIAITDPTGKQTGYKAVNNISNSTYSERDHLIIIPEPISGEYTVKVTSQGEGGKYKLLVGLITEKGDYWSEYEGNILVGATNTYKFNIPEKDQLPLYVLNLSKDLIKNTKKEFNRNKFDMKKRGTIESSFANIQGNINAALDAYLNNDFLTAKIKLERALINTIKLQDFYQNVKLEELKQTLIQAEKLI